MKWKSFWLLLDQINAACWPESRDREFFSTRAMGLAFLWTTESQRAISEASQQWVATRDYSSDCRFSSRTAKSGRSMEWIHCVHHIYSVLKLFEIAVCFAQSSFYKLSTPVMPAMLTVVNVVQTIIFDIAHPLYITFTVFWNFSSCKHNVGFWGRAYPPLG